MPIARDQSGKLALPPERRVIKESGIDAPDRRAISEDALECYEKPKIFNTDQGSQFTSKDWTDKLKAKAIQISMDGKGAWKDNVFIERLWRSLKYECVYLNAFDSVRDADRGIGSWIDYYNRERPHSSLEDLTPREAYEQGWKRVA